jgi:hypothetical protein
VLCQAPFGLGRREPCVAIRHGEGRRRGAAGSSAHHSDPGANAASAA